MAKVREKRGKLFIDFRYLGKRCRETTMFKDTPTNRKKLEKIAERIDAEILVGTFDYASYFPKSKHAQEMQVLNDRIIANRTTVPNFETFANVWYEEKQIEWRLGYQIKMRQRIDKYLTPHFGKRPLDLIAREDLLAFRTSLAKVTYGSARKPLTNTTINSVVSQLKMIMEEASLRYNFEAPFKKIKKLKEPKPEVRPLTLSEVWLFLNHVRADYRNYYLVRFFTGMRTSEIDGLKWRYVDFERREIRIRETYVCGQMDTTKTKESQREIQMSELVYNTLKQQYKVTHRRSDFVFCNRSGGVLNYNNINKRIWYPTLALLGLERRRAYETRHTAATLWLAAGENPEWIAKQMGHTTTKMLFNVYSRYVPDNTRKDGSAIDKLLKQSQNLNAQSSIKTLASRKEST